MFWMWGAKALTRLRICTDSARTFNKKLTSDCMSTSTKRTYVLCWIAQARRGICTRSVRLIFFIDVRIFKRIPNYVITSMRRFRVGTIRTPWKITYQQYWISRNITNLYQVSIRWWPASMVNGVARTQERWNSYARQMETMVLCN